MVMTKFVSMAIVKMITVFVKRATLDPTVTRVGFMLCVYYMTLMLSPMVYLEASFIQHRSLI